MSALSAMRTELGIDEVLVEVRQLRAEVAEMRAAQHPAAAPALEPLAGILGLPSAAAARMRAVRDPELARLGVPVGRRTLYRRDEVLSLLRSRAEASRGRALRSVGGAR